MASNWDSRLEQIYKARRIRKKLSSENFKTIEVKGLVFNPLNSKWRKSNNLSVNYIICSKKT